MIEFFWIEMLSMVAQHCEYTLKIPWKARHGGWIQALGRANRRITSSRTCLKNSNKKPHGMYTFNW
jgi:hypothetical protein